MGKIHNFHRKGLIDDTYAHEKIFDIATKEMQVNITMRYQYTPM